VRADAATLHPAVRWRTGEVLTLSRGRDRRRCEACTGIRSIADVQMCRCADGGRSSAILLLLGAAERGTGGSTVTGLTTELLQSNEGSEALGSASGGRACGAGLRGEAFLSPIYDRATRSTIFVAPRYGRARDVRLRETLFMVHFRGAGEASPIVGVGGPLCGGACAWTTRLRTDRDPEHLEGETGGRR